MSFFEILLQSSPRPLPLLQARAHRPPERNLSAIREDPKLPLNIQELFLERYLQTKGEYKERLSQIIALILE
ncbi:hypothetical protein EYC84_005464 [Monilinia fructicola]|uniref:Uncharacterized protein n=1 Tax=Monilinia fructicola TaxID=38448 RepID=A0A5M9K0F1_MONFR|nr:hypothetical protein EYC84_005464 [Monilinia fructicola]